MKFHHQGDLGDCATALPTIRAIGGGTLLFSPSNKTREPMDEKRMEFIRPMLLAQPYIHEVRMRASGEAVDVDFEDFRQGMVKNTTLAEIQRRHVIPMKRVDFSKPWLTVDPIQHGRPVFARSTRYHNRAWSQIWPVLLQKHPNALFIGTKTEHADFCNEFGNVAYSPVTDALQMAQIIAGSSVFLGNQSFPNSVAEGLKHPTIMEVCPVARDCEYPRENAKRILTVEDFNPQVSQPKIAIALQFMPDEIEAAHDLVNIICDIEKTRRDNVEFWLFIRDDVSGDLFPNTPIILDKFYASRIIKSTRRGRGWPDGCNDLWQSCMIQAARLFQAGKTDVEAVFTFEPDLVPIRKDWIDRLILDWQSAKVNGKLAVGLHTDAGNMPFHQNGNALFKTDIVKIKQELQSSSGPWDMFHRNLFTKQIGQHSDSMVNFYKRPHLMREDFEEVRKNQPNVTMIHGVKDGSARQYVRELIEKGTL